MVSKLAYLGNTASMADPNFAIPCYYYQTCPPAFTPPPYAFHPFQPPDYSPPIPSYLYHQPQPPPQTPPTSYTPYTPYTPQPPPYTPYTPPEPYTCTTPTPYIFNPFVATRQFQTDGYAPQVFAESVETPKLNFDASDGIRSEVTEKIPELLRLIDQMREGLAESSQKLKEIHPKLVSQSPPRSTSVSAMAKLAKLRRINRTLDIGSEDVNEHAPLMFEEMSERVEIVDMEIKFGVGNASKSILGGNVVFKGSGTGVTLESEIDIEEDEVGRDFDISDVEMEMKSGSEEFRKEKREMEIVANEHYVWDTLVDFSTVKVVKVIDSKLENRFVNYMRRLEAKAVKGVDEKESEIITPTLRSCATATLNFSIDSNIKALTADDVRQPAIGTLVEITQFNPSHDWGDAEPAIEKAQEAWFNDEDGVRTCVGLLKKPVAECRKHEDSLKDDGGLFIDIHSFLALGKDCVGWNFEKTENLVYLHIKQKNKPDPEDRPLKKPTLLAIGVDGGFDNHDVEYEEEYCIVILPDYATLPYHSVELHEKVRLAVDAVVSAEGAARKEQVASWTADKKQISEHALTLQQIENGVIISPSGWKCAKCDKTENLWLKLTDGMILCGRRNWGGSGGNNHAIEHYKETGYPLAVKPGTITSDLEGAYVFCYPEDESVLDLHLAQHLAFFGVDFSSLQKTEMTTAERELDQNTNFDWNRIQGSGQEVEPLWIFDPGGDIFEVEQFADSYP